ncbi:MAG: aspartate--tRNA(Asn) ligase [bacterium]
MRAPAARLGEFEGREVDVYGWVHRVRDLGGITFVVLRDRSGLVQTVFEESVSYTLESVLRVSGPVVANEKAPGGFEVHATETRVLAEADPSLPIAVNQSTADVGLEALLDNRMISLRNLDIRDVFLVQDRILKHFADHMRGEEFTEIKTSKIIGTGTEGGTGLFEVDYFDSTVYLAQSPQFYKQAMVASGLERVFEIAPAYRAEKHETPRHLNEYVSLDVEMGFIETLEELMDLEVRILSAVVEGLRTDIRERFNHDPFEARGIPLPGVEELSRIPRISHDEAKSIATEESGKRVFEINPEAERDICAWAEREHGVAAAFVTGFPRRKRPFYTMPDGQKTKSFDLLFRGLEITTGGLRLYRYDDLLEALPKFGLSAEALADYLSIFKYGCPPHGGFAIGLERLTQKLLGLTNVKEATLFPRDRRRVRP